MPQRLPRFQKIAEILRPRISGIMGRSYTFAMPHVALVTALDDAFLEYGRVMLASVLKHNPWFDGDVVVLGNSELSPLSEASRRKLKEIVPRVQFREIDAAPYRKYFAEAPKHLHPALLKLATFSLDGYDRVVFIDSDILCLGDIRALFTTNAAFAACPAGKDRAMKEKLAWRFKRFVGLNSGVLSIGKKYLGPRMHAKLLRYKSGPCADQDVISRFFRWRGMTCLDHRYNYHAGFFWKGDGSDGDVRLLHFAGDKPLAKPDLPRMKVWFDARAKLFPRS